VSAVSAPYRPGQSPWPDNQSQRPDRPPPLQFNTGDEAPRSNQALAWTLRVVGLVAVAVISGVVWWYIQSDNSNGDPTGYGGAQTEQQSSGKYDFKAEISSPSIDDDCGAHAYGTTQQFFGDKPCSKLTRSVFTTTIKDRTVYTSVSVVEFDDEDTAQALKQLTDSDGSGNVSDLVREGEVEVDGLSSLSGNDGYASERQGNRVTIVESDYKPGSDGGGDQDELDDVSRDALRLGGDITANGG
jgi:hypothetical protein